MLHVHAGSPTVLLHVGRELGTTWSAARPDVAGADLVLDVDVGIHGDVDEVVGGVAATDAVAAPVVGEADLLDEPVPEPQGAHPVGDQDPGLDGGARRDDGGPTAVLQPTLGRQPR